MIPWCPGSSQRATATPRGPHWTSRMKTAKMRKISLARDPEPLLLPFPRPDDADEEDDEGFITVGDNEEAAVNQVLVSIPVGKVSKPGSFSFDGKDRMFESDNEDDAEVQEQIKAVLVESGPLDDLQLSESEDESKSDTPDDDGDGGGIRTRPNSTTKVRRMRQQRTPG